MKELFTSSDYDALQRQIIEFMENHEVYSWDNVTIVTEKKPTDDKEDYYWQATLMPMDAKEAMKQQLCEEHGIIRHFWGYDDIRGFEPRGRPFTEDEVRAIASKIESCVDCQYGINWDFIDDIAQDVAPDAYKEFDEEE